MGVPGHSHFIRSAGETVHFEWEEGSPFVDIYHDGYPEPVSLCLPDFLALHAEAKRLVARIDAHQSGQIVKLTSRGPMFLVERHD